MKSKFKSGMILYVLVMTVVSTIMTVFLFVLVLKPSDQTFDPVIFALAVFFALISIWLMREIKFKWNLITIERERITVTPFLGLWFSKSIKRSEITGITRATESSRSSRGEVMYIYVNNYRAMEIADAYCRNFPILYRELALRTQKLGKEQSSLWKNFKSIFGIPIKLMGNTRQDKNIK